jgi:hypothetical protein
MARHPNAIPPDRQRRFDHAFRALAALCPGRERRLSDYKIATTTQIDPLDLERARWLLVSMGIARATEGGAAIARLARLGFAVSSQHGVWRRSSAVLPLDTPGLLYLGHVLPHSTVPWKRLEATALDTDPATLSPRMWCSAHQTMRVQTALTAEGHDLDGQSTAPGGA